MERAFVFGQVVSGGVFADREKERARLKANFMNGVNTIIISPRRWGKTSLVRQVSAELNQGAHSCMIVNMDVFMCRSQADFFRMFSQNIIRQTSSRWEEWAEMAKEFLSRLSPRFSFGADPLNDFTLSLDLRDEPQALEDILNLPQRIAAKKGKRLVICIDEFQQVGEFSESKSFQKALRSVWQQHDKVSYCIFGSKMHLMAALFTRQSMPFYKFGDVLYLQKIGCEHWVKFIMERFEQSGKRISEALAQEICESVEAHSFYVQQLSWLVWLRSPQVAGAQHVEQALEDLVNQNAMLYYSQSEGLTSYQLNFIRALLDGHKSEFSRGEIIQKYDLGSSANVARIRKSLEKQELIDISGSQVHLLDPVFGLWMRRMGVHGRSGV